MKLDFKKQLPAYQAKHNQFQLIEVPGIQYLMIDGHGDPNTSPEFAAAVTALFSMAYKLKFMSKQQLDRDYVVPPLEGLWWSADMERFTTARDKSYWDWTMMVMTPDWITVEMIEEMRFKLKDKDLISLSKLRVESLHEGLCVQTLHIGSYDEEGQMLEQMHTEFIPSNNLKMTGKHHEIYLSDFRKVAPDKLRTILRQPVDKLG